MTDSTAFRELTAAARTPLRVALTLQALATTLGLVPYVAIWVLARDVLTGTPDPGTVWAAVAAVPVAALAGFGLRLGAYGISHRADVSVQRAVRGRVAEHLARLPLGWFSGSSAQSLDSLKGDVDELHAAVAHGRMEVVAAVIAPVGALAWLLLVDWRLSLLVLAPSVGVYFAQRRVMSGASERQRGVMVALNGLIGAVSELVRDIGTLRVLGRGSQAAARMVAASDRFRDAQADTFEQENRRAVRYGTLVDPVTTLVLVLGGGLVMIAGGWLDPLDLLPFALVAITVAAPLQDVVTARIGMRTAYLAATRIRTLFDVAPLPEPATERGPSDGRMELDGVRVGGVDVRHMTVTTLYRHVGFVLQDAVLVRTSIRDNIRLACPDADDEQVHAAAAAAQIHDRILRLSRGYDSVFGADALLSGGERQRVTIARLLLADPQVLVLDEATAHVDAEAEAAIQTALSELATGRTVLVIAHRLTTVTAADQIVVLDGGRVVQRGTHPELIAEAGPYQRMWSAMQGQEAYR